MRPNAQVSLLLISDLPSESLLTSLQATGLAISVCDWSNLSLEEVRRSAVLLFDVPKEAVAQATTQCRRLRIELGDQHLPFVWVVPTEAQDLVAVGLEAGADWVCPVSQIKQLLPLQIRAMIRWSTVHQKVWTKASEAQLLNQRLQQAYHQIDSDLELTRRIHQAFQPVGLPQVQQVRFAVCHRPRSRIGGDFFDVLRLDEENVGFYVADAMGRGRPASSLLSIFVKKSMTPKEITGRSYRLVPPDELLSKINRDLVSLSLPDPPFVTMLWMQLHCREGILQFSRAAHPLPLYIPAQGKLEYWQTPGTLLGVIESQYPTVQKQLRPGDKVLIYTDGVQTAGNPTNSGGDILMEAAEKHREFPAQEFVDFLARDIIERARSQEDITLLVAEFQ